MGASKLDGHGLDVYSVRPMETVQYLSEEVFECKVTIAEIDHSRVRNVFQSEIEKQYHIHSFCFSSPFFSLK